MRRELRAIHRYAGLVFAFFWVLQGVTGALLVFHWELDDWVLSGPSSPLEPARFGKALESFGVRYPGERVSAVFVNGEDSGRFDVDLMRSGGELDVLRVDGRGTVLRKRPANYDWLEIGIFEIADFLHQTLFCGDVGRIFLGISGLALAGTLIVGLKLAWPPRGQWWRALWPKIPRASVARLMILHRAVGLWLVLPAIFLVICGVFLEFQKPLSHWFEIPRPPPSSAVAKAVPKGQGNAAAVGAAIQHAMDLYPGSSLAVILLPTPAAPWYCIKLILPGGWWRIQGLTTVYISSRDGRILRSYDERTAPLLTRALDSIYDLHTGFAGGVTFRWLALIVGLWLATMSVLGVSLWSARRSARKMPRG